MVISFLKNKKIVILSSIILIVLWQMFSLKLGSEVILPSPYLTLISLKVILFDDDFIKIVSATLERTLISFLISIISAILLGLLSYLNNYLEEFMKPVLSIIKSIPTMAFIVMALIWLSKDYAPILVGIFIAFPIFYQNIVESIKKIDKNIIEMVVLYEVSTVYVIKDIIIPNIIFSTLSILSSTFSLIIKVVIGGEVLGQPKFGIGGSIFVEKNYLNTSFVFAWVIVVLMIGIIFDMIQININKKIYKWKK